VWLVSRGWLVVVVLASCVAAGCTVSGAPVPTPEPTSTAAPSARPREIRLDGIDPCTLLTEEQKKQLGLTERSILDVNFQRAYNGVTKLCTTRGQRPRLIAVGVDLVVTAGIERFTPGSVQADLSPLTIRGFPALKVVPPDFPEFCTVVVDVAQGQLLDVQFRDGGSTVRVPQPDLCAGAQHAADLVMASLLAR
jgi:hypothetical protein